MPSLPALRLLATFLPPPPTVLFTPLGNRTQLTSSTTTNYTPNALNQYALVGTTNLSYDTNGNLTNDGTRAYTYDRGKTGSGLAIAHSYRKMLECKT